MNHGDPVLCLYFLSSSHFAVLGLFRVSPKSIWVSPSSPSLQAGCAARSHSPIKRHRLATPPGGPRLTDTQREQAGHSWMKCALGCIQNLAPSYRFVRRCGYVTAIKTIRQCFLLRIHSFVGPSLHSSLLDHRRCSL